MTKALLKWILREELENIRNEAEDDIQELREFILGSLSISFTSIRKRIDDVEALVLETSKAVERLEDGHNLLSGAHNHLDDIVQAQGENLDELAELVSAIDQDMDTIFEYAMEINSDAVDGYNELLEIAGEHEARLDELEESYE